MTYLVKKTKESYVMELNHEQKENLQFSLDSKMLKLAQKNIELADELKKTLNY